MNDALTRWHDAVADWQAAVANIETAYCELYLASGLDRTHDEQRNAPAVQRVTVVFGGARHEESDELYLSMWLRASGERWVSWYDLRQRPEHHVRSPVSAEQCVAVLAEVCSWRRRPRRDLPLARTVSRVCTVLELPEEPLLSLLGYAPRPLATLRTLLHSPRHDRE